MNKIDILEEKEKEAIKDLEEYLHWEELQGFSMLPRDKHIETLLNLVSTLIAENKELKEFKENIEKIDKKQLDKLYKDAQKALKEYRETQNKVAKLEEENKELKERNKTMLSDEEKKALELIKINNKHKYCDKDDVDFLLNLIEKQSKEIEELKVNNKKLQDKCKELIFEKQGLTSALLDSTPNDKIKAKIEIRKEEKENCKDSIEEKYLLREIYVLQSLLEKE